MTLRMDVRTAAWLRTRKLSEVSWRASVELTRLAPSLAWQMKLSRSELVDCTCTGSLL